MMEGSDPLLGGEIYQGFRGMEVEKRYEVE